MNNKVLVFIFLSIINYSFGQKLRKITNTDKNYEISIPEDWEENMSFYSSSLSLMATKTATSEDLKPVEAIAIKHLKTDQKDFDTAYNEYLGLLKNYYTTNFQIAKTENVTYNGVEFKKIIVKITSEINGKNRKNTMLYRYSNGESMMITLTSTNKNYEKNKELYQKILSSLITRE